MAYKDKSGKDELPSPIIFILIAGVLVVAIKYFMFDGRTPFQDAIYDSLHQEEGSGTAKDNLAALMRDKRTEEGEEYDLYEDIESGFLDIDVPMPGEEGEAEELPVEDVPEEKESKAPEVPDSKPAEEYAMAPAVVDEADEQPQASSGYIAPVTSGVTPRVAVIIDDVGMNREYSQKMIGLDPDLTLSFLPYAPGVQAMADEARVVGHELMLHAPMEAMDSSMDLGPMALTTDMEEQAFKDEFENMLGSFVGYDGVNNHMGSRMTQDSKRMGWVMEVLRRYEPMPFFIDSKTIHNSVASKVARQYHMPYAARHVFLDHEDDIDAIRKRLALLEEGALKRGYAIAIGHPRKATYEALKEWIPTLEEKGLQLVPARDLIMRPVVAEVPEQPGPGAHYKLDDGSGAVEDVIHSFADERSEEHPAPRGQ